MPPALRIGTRGSPLALVQAGAVQSALENAARAQGETLAVSIEKLLTTGDKVTDRPLTGIGGKGLFTKEIDRALLAGEVDCAVHSMKDMESVLAPGLMIGAVLARSDPRDCLIGAPSLTALPAGSRVGTSAVRRRAQVLAMRPDLNIVEMRGNVGTRLAKRERGEADVIILAKAGLDRLGRSDVISYVFSEDEILTDAGQGVIAIVVREDDARMRSLVASINHAETETTARAERAMSAALDGSCRSPIGAYAEIKGDALTLRGAIFTPDGREAVRIRMEGKFSEPDELGRKAASQLRSQGSPAILSMLDEH